MISASVHWRSRSSSVTPSVIVPMLLARQLQLELFDQLCTVRLRPIARGHGVGELHHFGAKLELRLGLSLERREGLDLFRRQRPRHPVDDAYRPERVSIRRDERRSCVEANARLARDQRVVLEPGVPEGIRYGEHVVLLDRVGTERDAPRRLRDRHADARLEPLAIGVDQCHEGHGRAADLRGEQREIVERLLWLRVQDAVPRERRESGRFVPRHRVPL
jgi:hypothetical protein